MEKKLTICFIPWLVFNENDDFDALLFQVAQRKFNCIRIEDGAGLLWDEQGKERGEIHISQPFGKYTTYTTYRTIVDSKRINILDRILRICRTAKKYGLQVILSSWFFLHTNWFCKEKLKKSLFAMSVEEKMQYFSDELSRLLDVLRQEDLIDVVAFA